MRSSIHVRSGRQVKTQLANRIAINPAAKMRIMKAARVKDAYDETY